MDRKRMRGILSQMHKRKSPQKNIKRLQRDRNISFFFLKDFFVSLQGDKREKRENKHKNMSNTYNKLTSLRVSLGLLI